MHYPSAPSPAARTSSAPDAATSTPPRFAGTGTTERRARGLPSGSRWATIKARAKRRAGVTVFEFARVMGTSVRMIERHYGALVDGAHAAINDRLDALEANLADAAGRAGGG